ncbi:TauD/TfdA dioxygenase family protein [Paraburkholderia caribensis]|uniref:TauD/TfdA dioxygenase family protein n=1 Tax=Paraburkholderia caribensis TaxID=75105 RepID=UPI001CB3BC64|nr:TauD/TfdA family dioxygenase [Paraburkholderia caribensis]CAG9269640.1 Taurine dioxygenase, alpha-ketoglutarate-dependent [Paraburkholderia caribensis]
MNVRIEEKTMGLKVRRIGYALGAEITGVDLREPLSDIAFREIEATFLDNSVVVVRGPSITREHHIAFARRFGEIRKLAEVTLASNDPNYPELLLLINKTSAKSAGYQGILRTGGEIWHSDKSATLNPLSASLLRAVAIPSVGGDTLFSNGYLAYEALSDSMKRVLEGLYAVHVGGGGEVDGSTPEKLAASLRRNAVAQPIVRVHPRTGRKALYFGANVKRIEGMTLEEGAPLIDFLMRHIARPQFIYRHIWQKDDLVIWDNRCTMHMAADNYDRSEYRHMERISVKGEPSGHPYLGPLEYVSPVGQVEHPSMN